MAKIATDSKRKQMEDNFVKYDLLEQKEKKKRRRVKIDD